MDAELIRQAYERFVAELAGRAADINYDARYDVLYIFGPIHYRSSSQAREKPRTVDAASGIHVDLLMSNRFVYGVEIEDFARELDKHGSLELMAWWRGISPGMNKGVKGKMLADALQRVSLV
jgi:hypothetical protein